MEMFLLLLLLRAKLQLGSWTMKIRKEKKIQIEQGESFSPTFKFFDAIDTFLGNLPARHKTFSAVFCDSGNGLAAQTQDYRTSEPSSSEDEGSTEVLVDHRYAALTSGDLNGLLNASEIEAEHETVQNCMNFKRGIKRRKEIEDLPSAAKSGLQANERMIMAVERVAGALEKAADALARAAEAMDKRSKLFLADSMLSCPR